MVTANGISQITASLPNQKVQSEKKALHIRSLLWHLFQMVLAMEAGMGVYHLIFATALTRTYYGELVRSQPVFGYSVMVVAMIIPMIALMRFYHKSTWRYCLEMTAAMVVPLVPLALLVQAGLLPSSLIKGCGIGDILMITAMAGYMWYAQSKSSSGSAEHNCH